MTFTADAQPAHSTLADLARGFLTGGVVGASLAAFVSGCVVEKALLVVVGLALPAVYGLVLFLATLPRRAREAAVVPRTALAVIESLEAVGGESSDVPVRFELSVAPDGAPAYRVEIRQDINLVELPDYRPRGIVVVEYPPDRPAKTRIVKRPTPEWEERAAGAQVDSVPGPAMKSDPPVGCAGGLLTLLGLLLGAGAVLLLFRADLFGADDSGTPRSPSVSSSSSTTTTTTTTVTSSTGTVTVGPGRSMLDRGELRRAVESLTEHTESTEGTEGTENTGHTGHTGNTDRRRALTVVVQDRLLTVVFSPTGVQSAGFDPRSLPFDRLPGLVEEARTTLGTGSPRSWQLTADGITGSLTLRVVVTGDGGTGTLEADGQGHIRRRSGS
ncbi:hypothetical protein ACFUCQ_05475 [Streptomyces sp. NPDC057197]|uniref:hypothetical protein n=1 Tax=unclassified Streptomyces TaxID=2593676 RepID=UPI0007F9EB79|nr:hypothetical protein [Streptomyces sp. SAT1]ANO42005.1 hypothetical protein A8713_032605 [Streptomyces sp. SAT1]